MSPDRWQQIEHLYHLALDQEAGSRAAFVANACGGDEALKREVESLLEAGDGADSYLEIPAVQLEANARGREDSRWSLAGRAVSHYRVLERLGGSEDSEVYHAEDTRLGRPVALKFVYGCARDTIARERFQHEARMACQLAHPNICTLYDVDEWEGVPFLVMEFLEGKPLDSLLRGQPFEAAKLVDLSLQITEGLDAAHARYVWHRDLKPANLFVTSGGQVKILDFALPPALRGSVQGNPDAAPYLSPEHLRGEDPDARSDLFCLGAVMYEMATGRRAFNGRSTEERLQAVMSRSPASVLQLNPSLPAKLDDIISKALAKPREERYQQAAELRADLRRLKREVDASRSAGMAAAATANAPTQSNEPSRLGRYQITGRIGEGGMGVVYQGLDPVIGRPVAIKAILPDQLGSPEAATELRQRLMREARAAGSLTHPNIVTVFDAGEQGGVTYIVMELIRGSALSNFLSEDGVPAPVSRAISILAEVGAALDFAHGRGVIHRDIKPANIMIQTDESVKLADFGIAKLANTTVFTRAGRLTGTPIFIPPERLRGEQATPRSDQYSLAVVAWILLSGSPPFEGKDIVSLMENIRNEQPPKSSHLSEAADAVLRRALAKDPAARFESCASFVAALREACVPARPQPVGRGKRFAVVALGVTAAGLLAVAGIALRVRPASNIAVQDQKPQASSPASSSAAPKEGALPLPDPPKPVTGKGSLPGDVPASTDVSTASNRTPQPGSRAACQSTVFDIKQYGDALSGEMIWDGSLASGGRLSIDGRRVDAGRLRGDVLPQNTPVHISVSPATVKVAAGPAPANCWQSGLSLRNEGELQTEVHIQWRVYQP
jgi:serine/threonine protein kinase